MKYRFLLLFLLTILISGKLKAQCTGCGITVTAPSADSIVVTADNQVFCLTGNGTITGTINLRNHNNITICIASTVTMGAGFVINPGNASPGVKFINYGNWTRDFSNGVMGNNIDFDNYGTVTSGPFNLTGNNIINNYGTFHVTGGDVNVNSGSQFITHAGSVTVFDGNFYVPSGGNLQIGGIIHVKGDFRVNSNNVVSGLPPGCAGIIIDGSFLNDGNVGYPNPIVSNISPTSGSGQFHGTVNSTPPSISVSPTDTKICAGGNGSFSVTASGTAITYQWQVNTGNGFVNLTDGGVYSGAFTNTLKLTGAPLSMNGYLYRVLVTACPYPVYSSSAKLTVSDVPIATKTSLTNICYQSSLLLDTKATNLNVPQSKWYLLPDKTNSVATGPTYTVYTPGTYVVNLVNTDQCTTVDTFIVSMYPYTVLDLGKPADTVCSNVAEPIKVNGTWTTIQWTKTPTGVTIPDGTTSWNATVSGLYEVTATDAHTCTQKDNVSITYSTAPSIDLGKDTSLICFDAPKAITVPGGPYATVVWQTPAGVTVPNGTMSYIPKKSGTYKVTVGTSFQCFASDQVGVTYDTNPPVDLGPGNKVVCFNVASPILVSGGPYQSVKWTTDNTITIPDGTMRVDPKKTGNYQVTVIDPQGCTSSDKVQIAFNDSLATFDLGDSTMVACYNAPKNIVVTGTYKSIVWTAPVSIPNNTTQYFPNKSGWYKVTVSNYSQCSASDSVRVTYEGDLPFDLDPLKTVCWSDNYVINADKVGYGYQTIKWTAPESIPDQTTSWKPTHSGNYRVDVTSKLGCPKSDSVNITFFPKITIGLNGKDTLSCGYEGNYYIKAPGGMQKYIWTGPKPSGIIVHDSIYYPRATGEYVVKVYADISNTCFTSDSVHVTYDKDSVDLGLPNQTVCGNDPDFILKVLPNVFTKIIWTDNVGISIPNGTTEYRPTKSGIYKVTATKANGCFSIDSTQITYVDTLKVDLGGDSATSCEFKKTVLKPISGANLNYIWTNNAGVKIPDGTSVYTPVKPGEYKVVVSVKQYPQCSGEDSIYVSIPDTINLHFNGDTGVSCFGAGYKLCGGSGYAKYDWQPSGIVPAGTKECYSPTSSGLYKLTITDKYTCQKSDSIYVKFYDKLQLGLNGADTAACYPYQDFLIHATAGYAKYVWSPNISSDSLAKPVYTGKKSQTYVVTATNKDGCKGSDSTTVHFVPDILLDSIPGGDTTACGYAKYTIRAGGGFLRYDWVNNVAGPHDSTYVPTASGKYWVTVTTKRGNCKKTSDTTNVKFVPDIDLDLGGPVTSCSYTDTLTLDAGPGFDKYMWQNNPALNNRKYHPVFPKNVVNTEIDTIHVYVTYQKICHTSASRKVTFIRQDTLTIGGDTTVCPHYPVTMSPGFGFDYYAWHNSLHPDVIISEDPVLTVTDTGRYTVDVTSVCGFQNPSRSIHNYAAPKVDLGPDTTICLGKKIELQNRLDASNTYTYVWSEKGMTDNSTSTISTLMGVSESGTFYVKAIEKHKCYTIDSITVTTNDEGACFILPNLITPNNDRHNDEFEVGGIRLNHWNLEIYNRWGDKVFQTEKYNNDWDAHDVSDGVYYYHLKDPDNDRQYKGWLQVVKKD